MSRHRSSKRDRSTSSYRWEVKKGDQFDNLARMIGEMSGHIFEGAPTQIIGTASREGGRILGVKATYGTGQTVTVRIRKDGSHSLSFGLRFSTKVSTK